MKAIMDGLLQIGYPTKLAQMPSPSPPPVTAMFPKQESPGLRRIHTWSNVDSVPWLEGASHLVRHGVSETAQV